MKLNRKNIKIIKSFVEYCARELKIKNDINLVLVEKKYDSHPSAGSYNPVNGEIRVVIKNRAIADCLRTIAHELTHQKQNEPIKVFPNTDEELQPLEDEANVNSGKLVRFWGRKHKEIYDDIK
jgi:hypothetical protein